MFSSLPAQFLCKHHKINCYFIIVIFLLVLVGSVSAVKSDLKTNEKISTNTTSVTLTPDGEVTFTKLKSGISVNTKIKVDKELIKSDKSEKDKEDVTLSYTKKGNKGKKSTPDATFTYTYTENQIKETIVLQEDMDLSFPVTIPSGQKMIQTYSGEWKIVNATNGNTMIGLLAVTPFGVDAAGRNITMDYTWDGSELHLVYNRTISVYNVAKTRALGTGKSVYDYYPITYPLTIDPTWIAEGDHYIGYIMVGTDNYTVIKWNTTGTTDWNSPDTGDWIDIDYLVVGAGGAGGPHFSGGGGAGGMTTSSLEQLEPNTNYDITVGAGVSNGSGQSSTLEIYGGTVTGYGGGMGGWYVEPTCHPPASGGSGGGGIMGVVCTNSGASGTSGEGYAGGTGYNGINWEGGGGGGGGAAEVGHNSGQYEAGAGGDGTVSNITGENLKYSCGGGGGTGLSGAGYGDPGCTGAGGGGGGGSMPIAARGMGGGATEGDPAVSKGGSGVVILRYLTPPPPPVPIAAFTASNTSGTAPLWVWFDPDTSTESPTSWNWSYRNVTGDNNTVWFNTSHYPAITFGVGNYSIQLNASNANGANISTQTTFVNVSMPPRTVALFNVYNYNSTAPNTVGFEDTSTNNPTAWNWSYQNVTGNNTQIWFNTSQDPVIMFGVGNYSIKLNATNYNGSNISTQITYINVSPYINYTTAGFTIGLPAGFEVGFTDTSTGDLPPLGWTWFFGDEPYNQTWVEQTASAGWTARSDFASVVMNDGSIVIMGGNASGTNRNDTWRSTDQGISWTQLNTSGGWSARNGHKAAALGGSGLILMGGRNNSVAFNDTWGSADYGTTWRQLNSSSGWSARYGLSTVTRNDGSIIVMGGSDFSGSNLKNDTWRSVDYGVTWTRLSAGAEWTARTMHTSVKMLDNSIITTGGYSSTGPKNDTWRSTNGGINWTVRNSSGGWSSRYLHTSTVMPDNSIILTSGSGNKNDVWRALPNNYTMSGYGAVWRNITGSPGWSGRTGASTVGLPDGSLVLIGGYSDTGSKNDVWRFNPVSTEGSQQNPTHIYPEVTQVYYIFLQTSNYAGTSYWWDAVSLSTGPTPTPTPMGQLVFDGYVKDAESTDMITCATLVYSQGLANTIYSDINGYYITTSASLVPNVLTSISVSADGHGSYQHEFTPISAGIIRINMTLLSTAPVYTGEAIGGIARNPPYNRTIDNATINIHDQNPMGYGNYTVITNSAGYYLNDGMSGATYNVWGNKSGYVNSTVYEVVISGGPI